MKIYDKLIAAEIYRDGGSLEAWHAAVGTASPHGGAALLLAVD